MADEKNKSSGQDKKTTEHISDQTKAFNELSASLQRKVDVTQKVISAEKELTQSLQKTTEEVQDLDAVLEEMAHTSQDSAQGVLKDSELLRKSFKAANKEVKNSTGLFSKLKNSFVDWVKESKNVVMALLTFDNLFNTLKTGVKWVIRGVFDLTKSLAKLAVTIALAPFKMLNWLIGKAGSITGISPLRLEIENVREAFGSLAGDKWPQLTKNIREYRKEFSKLNMPINFGRYFGYGLEGLAEALKENRELLQAAGAEYNNLVDTVVKLPVQLSLLRKGLGYTNEQQAAMMINARRLGENIEENQRLLATYAVQMGKRFRIEAKSIGKAIGDMAVDFAHFGTFGPKVMVSIATQTRRLGIEIKDLLGLIDKFDNFEDAANSAAMFSQAFSTNVDALELLKTEDPTKRADMLQKAFKNSGRTFESMSRIERKYLANLSGMDEKTAAATFGQVGLTKSYSDVQKGASEAQFTQQNLTKTIQALAYSIKQIIPQNTRTFTSFWDALTQGFELGVMRSGEMRGTLLSLRQALQSVFQAGIKMGIAFVKLFPGFKEFLHAVRDFFSPSNMTKIFNGVNGKMGIVGAFKKMLTELGSTDPSKAMDNFFNSVRDLLTQFYGTEKVGSFISTMYSSFDSMSAAFIRIGGWVVKKLFEGLGIALEKIAILISGGKIFNKTGDAMVNGLTESVKKSKSMQAFEDVLSNLYSTFGQKILPQLETFNAKMKDVLFNWAGGGAEKGWGENIWIAIKKVLTVAFEKLKEWGKNIWKEYWPEILLYGLLTSNVNLPTKIGMALIGITKFAYDMAEEASKKQYEDLFKTSDKRINLFLKTINEKTDKEKLKNNNKSFSESFSEYNEQIQKMKNVFLKNRILFDPQNFHDEILKNEGDKNIQQLNSLNEKIQQQIKIKKDNDRKMASAFTEHDSTTGYAIYFSSYLQNTKLSKQIIKDQQEVEKILSEMNTDFKDFDFKEKFFEKFNFSLKESKKSIDDSFKIFGDIKNTVTNKISSYITDIENSKLFKFNPKKMSKGQKQGFEILKAVGKIEFFKNLQDSISGTKKTPDEEKMEKIKKLEDSNYFFESVIALENKFQQNNKKFKAIKIDKISADSEIILSKAKNVFQIIDNMQTQIENENFIQRLTPKEDLVNKIENSVTTYNGILDKAFKVSERINKFGKDLVKNKPNVDSVVNVGKALIGDSTITLKTEPLVITVNMSVKMDAAQIAKEISDDKVTWRIDKKNFRITPTELAPSK